MRPQCRSLRFGRRSTALLAMLAMSGGLLVVASEAGSVAAATPTPPPNPSAGQISAAQQHKLAVAAEVGRLTGQVIAAQTQLQSLQGQAELAEQKVAYAISKKRLAEAAEVRAKGQVLKAARTVGTAHTAFVRYLQASYMTGSSDTSTGALLTAQDPTTLLQQTTLERYEAENKVDAIGNLQTATVAKSNADAAALRATRRAKQAETNAQRQKRLADAAVSAQLTQEAALKQTLSSSQAQLTSARSQLSILNHQHTQFLAYQVHLAQVRAARIARIKREREQARQARIRRERKLERQRERERERRREQHNGGSNNGGSNNGGGSNGGGGDNGGGTSGPPASSGDGGWTPAKGREAVRRARYWLGEPYSWAGGDADGPTYGVCAGDGAYNDCHVKGFDCSGLTLYAWAPYESMAHYTVLQYAEAGSHPSLDDLRKGDLIFYSDNGSASGIHHVAIYIGHGEIIQAPYSGAYIEISSMYDPGPIYGAVRPLT